MDKLFNILTYVIGFLFLLMGLQWLVDPTSAAAGLGMSLLSGHGLSTQIGDLASFFLVVGVFNCLIWLCSCFKNHCIFISRCGFINRQNLSRIDIGRISALSC